MSPRAALVPVVSVVTLMLACQAGGDVDLGGGVDAGDAGAADARPDVADAGCSVLCGPSAECCAPGTECVAGACLPACDGARCGADDELCCGAGELCLNNACGLPGGECIDDVDCDGGDYCDLVLGRCLPRPEGELSCLYMPPPETFEPELVWEHGDTNAVTVPLVIPTTDDNGDGVVDGHDIPDVVTTTYPGSWENLRGMPGGRLVGLSGDTGAPLWESTPAWDVCPAPSPAAGDLDGDGTVEIVTVAVPGGGTGCPGELGLVGGPYDDTVVAFSHRGEEEWAASPPFDLTPILSIAVSVADLDLDGLGEVMTLGGVFEHDGTLRFADMDLLAARAGLAPFAADVDDDPDLEVIGGNGVWDPDGTRLWAAAERNAERAVALARLLDLPGYPGPQLFLIEDDSFQIVDAASGDVLLGPVAYTMDDSSSVGTPAVADFDGDGQPEVGVADDDEYFVFDFELDPPYIRWRIPSSDSSIGSVSTTVFDFDGDGSVEVLWQDECLLHILSGDDGREILKLDNTSITAFEYPVVADVTADGRANIVVVGNGTGGPEMSVAAMRCPGRGGSGMTTPGIRVYRDRLDNWIPARAIWNQHYYFFDNILSDGSLPAPPRQSWSTHNTFRVNRYPNPDTVFLAPDLRVVALDATSTGCPTDVVLRARIQNAGARSVPIGVPVSFYASPEDGSPVLLGTVSTTSLLAPGAGEWVELTVSPDAFGTELYLRFIAVADDDGTGTGLFNECNEDNNRSDPVVVDCRLI